MAQSPVSHVAADSRGRRIASSIGRHVWRWFTGAVLWRRNAPPQLARAERASWRWWFTALVITFAVFAVKCSLPVAILVTVVVGSFVAMLPLLVSHLADGQRQHLAKARKAAEELERQRRRDERDAELLAALRQEAGRRR